MIFGTRAGTLRTRRQRSAGHGLTKFVGREQEMQTMKRAAEQAKAGRGQIGAAMGGGRQVALVLRVQGEKSERLDGIGGLLGLAWQSEHISVIGLLHDRHPRSCAGSFSA